MRTLSKLSRYDLLQMNWCVECNDEQYRYVSAGKQPENGSQIGKPCK